MRLSTYFRLSVLLFACAWAQPASAADPGPRTRAEVEGSMSAAELADTTSRPVRITIVWGDKDHGPDQHDYPRYQTEWTALLGKVKGVTASNSKYRPTAEQWKTADLLICFLNAAWTDSDYVAMDAYLNRGGGMLFIHQGVAIAGGGAKLSQRLGLASNGSVNGGKYDEGPLELDATRSGAHVITQGFTKPIAFEDEVYWLMLGDTSKVKILATSVKDGAPRPMLWIHNQGKGMAIGSILGHNYWTFNDPLYRLILLRSMAFALGQRLGRFAPVVTQGLVLTGPSSVTARLPNGRSGPKGDAPVSIRMDGREGPTAGLSIALPGVDRKAPAQPPATPHR